MPIRNAIRPTIGSASTQVCSRWWVSEVSRSRLGRSRDPRRASPRSGHRTTGAGRPRHRPAACLRPSSAMIRRNGLSSTARAAAPAARACGSRPAARHERSRSPASSTRQPRLVEIALELIQQPGARGVQHLERAAVDRCGRRRRCGRGREQRWRAASSRASAVERPGAAGLDQQPVVVTRAGQPARGRQPWPPRAPRAARAVRRRAPRRRREPDAGRRPGPARHGSGRPAARAAGGAP